MARTMMRHKDVDQDLWADAIKTAVYIENRVTSRALPVGKTPFELWTGNKPNVSHMRVFGSTCWVVLHQSHIDGTFSDKAAKGVFVGYPDGSKAYKVILDDGKVVKARSVVFAKTNVRDVAEIAEELPEEKVVEVETGLRSASDGEDVNADNDDKDDKQDDGSDKSADDNQGSGGSQDTLRRSGRARRPPVEYWRPVSLAAHDAPTTYVQVVQGQESCYGKEHWAAINRFLRYVKGSMDKGLVFDKSSSCVLQGFSDADWAGLEEKRRSTTGFTFIFGGAAVSWGSKLQKTVGLSTMEAENMALCEASKKAAWLNKLVQSVASQGLQTAISGGPINIKVDNSGCIDFAKNPVEHKRTKHIDIRYHFVREAITTVKVILEHCATEDMVADPMTKQLGKTKHDKHVEAMGLC